MLQLFDIRKSYTTANFTQTALDDVSISFRDNEFVAILGPSGSGKTTMLNIVGGLDHYDAGDLVIDGVSTKQYKDHDWDTYRNNRIGFVFQSYNLIPHQTVLSNVELALTLSGVSPAERKQRATEALKEVGLGDHISKKPSQLSGGQMQRVAIARALINDPEILLADEPTGALDSKTSVQIMGLLTEIAKDRLVIMVTHNPELAKQYATRTVNLRDGAITDDTNPYTPTEDELKESDKTVRKTVMSFFTAVSLSFNNLMTKKGRTLMTAFAGSIGIIGIAAILALANGVSNYIKSVEEDTLSIYPLSIESTGFDMTSMMVAGSGMGDSSGNTESSEATEDSEAEGKDVNEVKMISNMFSRIGSNDLASLKTYFESGESGIDEYANSIQYSYNVTPQIFNANTEEGIRQVNPDKSFSSLGLGSSNSSNSLMAMSMSTDIFYEMVDDTRLIEEQYEIVSGQWPQKHNECLLVLTQNGGISDFTLYSMGLRDHKELEDMVRQFANEEDVVVPEDTLDFSYDDIMNAGFKVVPATSYYEHDSQYNVWKDMSEDEAYMKRLIEEGTDLHISGIVKPNEGATATALSPGIYYTSDLSMHLIETAAETDIVKAQLADPKVNVFSGRTFEEEEEESGENIGLDSLISVDGQAIQSAFTFDTSALALDMEAIMREAGKDSSPSSGGAAPAPAPDLNAIAENITINVDQTALASLIETIMTDFLQTLPAGATADDFAQGFPVYLSSPAVQTQIANALPSIVGTNDINAQVQAALADYMGTTMGVYIDSMTAAMQKQMTTAMEMAMTQLMTNMSGAMGVNEQALAAAFQFNMDEQQLTQLMMSFMTSGEENSADTNLKKLGYADLEKPGSIDIYPIDFESKEKIIGILDAYNEQMEAEEKEDQIITYTDIVGTLMSSVTNIINMVSYVLVAFVAISLVVSSIMIGVITYISVLERKKEIGILRAIGASKKDISHVFNAETLIVGFVAGTLGILVTVLVTIPINLFVYAEFGIANVALLPWTAAIVLIIISMFLTFLAGLIPSSAASRKDPVEALRSE